MLKENIIRFFKRIFKSKSVHRISSENVDISNSNQVRKIEEVTDITNLLEHFTILCDVNNNGIGLQIKQAHNGQEILNGSIKNGSIRYINKEVDINVRMSFDERSQEYI